MITEKNPGAKIACMVPFCEEIKQIVKGYHAEHKTNIFVVDTTGRMPPEPLHTLRDGYRIAAAKLTEELKKGFGI